MRTRALNIDCMDFMAGLPDNAYDLAIVDPPYGIGEDGEKNHRRGSRAKPTLYIPKQWDNEAPPVEYFSELKRVSKNQIIWGANHFISRLAIDSSCWIVWDKDNGESDFADCELAWTSFNTAVRRFKWTWSGMRQQNMRNKEKRIHPTQKPVALYRWLLTKYAKSGDRILDTHLGSGSSRIAAEEMGFEFVGCELDEEYFEAQEKRFAKWYAQGNLFRETVAVQKAEQLTIT